MAEAKNTFTGGKMDKDQDERIVQSGTYREALNITVATSEDSDVGAAQNILGNIKVTEAISGPPVINSNCTLSYDLSGSLGYPRKYFGTNKHIAAVVDPQTDMMYRFITTVPNAANTHGVWMDRIVEYNTTARKEVPWYEKEKSVVVDIWKVMTKVKSITAAPGCDQTELTVCNNSYQLRSGMRIMWPNMNPNLLVHIESVAHNGSSTDSESTIILSANISGYIIVGMDISFHGDRNLSFDADRNITGINIIDGMLFWTDNYSEPKKVNIKRCKAGSDTYRWKSFSEVAFYGVIGTLGSIDIDGNWVQGDAAYSDFDQHTLLIVEDELVIECNNVESNCPRGGCTDPTASNYDYTATSDDGSCIRHTYGCTDSTATNYDPAATFDDGSCIPYTYGCTDSTADNYNPTVNTSDNSCVWLGCTDPTAFNYDAVATIDDDSCIHYIYGCTDPTAYNYNASVNVVSDNSCVWLGCTDPTAFNYDAVATIDDGSCTGTNSNTWGGKGCMNTMINGRSHTHIPDKDFRKALNQKMIGQINWVEAGGSSGVYGTHEYIEQSIIDNITDLDVSGLGISSMEGIECFRNLEILNCSNNSIGGGPVNFEIYNLQYLREVYCDNNQLDSLNVGGCTSLVTLVCSNNYLTNLEVDLDAGSINSVLTYLDCHNNQLTSLNLSENTSLNTLICNNNNLTSLNIHNGNNNNMPNTQFVSTPTTTGTGLLTIKSDSGSPITLNGSHNYTNIPTGTTWIS
jgi:hypothetical protein